FGSQYAQKQKVGKPPRYGRGCDRSGPAAFGKSPKSHERPKRGAKRKGRVGAVSSQAAYGRANNQSCHCTSTCQNPLGLTSAGLRKLSAGRLGTGPTVR